MSVRYSVLLYPKRRPDIDNSCSRCVFSLPCNDDEYLFGEFHCTVVGKRFDPDEPPKRGDVDEWLHKRFAATVETYTCPSFTEEKREGPKDRRYRR